MAVRNRRALYLHAKEPVQVVDAWPALMVFQASQAPRLIPLTRISRIVASGEIEWDQEALIACMRADIPIILVDSKHFIVGWLTPAQRREGPLARSLIESGQRGSWRNALDSWQAAEERQGILALLRCLKRPPYREDLRPESFWPRALALLDRGCSGTTRHDVQILQPFLFSLLSRMLLDAGAPKESVAAGRKHGILMRFWNILRWDLLILIHRLHLDPGHRWSGRDAAACFESNSEFFVRRIEDLIEELEQLIDYVERVLP